MAIPKFDCVCCKVLATAGKCRHCGEPVCMKCRLDDLHVCYCSCSPEADECTCGFRAQAFEQAEEVSGE